MHFRRLGKIAKIDSERRRVCPSFRMEQLLSHWTDFHGNLYLSVFFFENLSRKFKIH